MARIRYLPDERPDRFQVRIFGGASWNDIMLSGAEATGGIVIEDMAIELLYYITADETAAQETGKAQEDAQG